MKPYSQHLRECVIIALEAGVDTQAEIAELFQVSQSTVEKWKKRWQDTHSCAALPVAHGPEPTLRAYDDFLRAAVKQQPDVTLVELCEQVSATHQVDASPSMMSRTLQRLKLGRKKKTLHDSQRGTPRVQALRDAFHTRITDELSRLLNHLKFLDESGLNLGMTRLFGRAEPGVRVYETTPGYSGPHYTVIAALGLKGVTAPWLLEGALDMAAFEAYVKHELAKTLKPGDLVLLDNLAAHKSKQARLMIEARGARLVFLSPYSPDYNPIELCWSKVKTALRAAKARTFETLLDALADALHAVLPADVEAWFAHCGYAVP
jgi:transposase